MPCLQHRSNVFAPASASFSTAMICSPVDLLRTLSPPSMLYSSGVLYFPVLLFYWVRSNGARFPDGPVPYLT